MKLVYWSAVGIIFFTYIGYPAVIYLLSKIFYYKKSITIGDDFQWPSVSLLIAAYNEEKVIEEKIRNCLAIDYPKDRFHILIASDGSTDSTNKIVRKLELSHSNITFLELKRTGKSGVLNEAIKSITDEIVVFSDANTEYSADAIKKIVAYFTDPHVGCVSGRLIYRNPGKILSGKGEGIYWRYETTLKKMESKLGYVAGANGAIYAIRRELYEPHSARTINDDFTLSMKIVARGYLSIYEENAIVYENVAPTMRSEFKRHVRDGAGHYVAISCLTTLLNPFKGLRSFIFWSHRIFRWIVPLLLILIFIINIFLAKEIMYGYLFYLQLVFYSSAVIGWIFTKTEKIPILLYVPFYFCNLNLALLLGLLKVLSNAQKTTWDRTERI